VVPLLPYRKLVFEVPGSSPGELVRRLGREVAEGRWSWVRWTKRSEIFTGTVSDEGFQIRRIIYYRNSFLPIIRGRFCPHAKGVRVEVTMRLPVAMLVFSSIWLSFAGLVTAAGTIHWLATGKGDAALLVPPGLFVFFYLMVTLSFGFEANNASELLKQVLGAEAVGAGSQAETR
jgi:hypothetical protein